MRKILLSTLFAIIVLGSGMSLMTNPAHAYDGNGNPTDSKGNRCSGGSGCD